MKTLPYARKIVERRKRDDAYWLAIVALGWLRDSQTLADVPGIARLGCPADVDPALADWRVVTGLDVLCMPFAIGAQALEAFTQSALAAIWRARPATLWMGDGRGRASRVNAIALRGRTEFVPWTPAKLALDKSFRAEVEFTRRLAFEHRAAPLYSGPEFSAARLAAVDHAAPA